MSRPALGATTARVTPPVRATAMPLSRPLIAGTTSSDAEKGDFFAAVSLAWGTPSTPSMPRSLMPTTRPGVTTLPLPSITVAPAGAAPGPTLRMRPPSITTVALSMVVPAPVITVALVMAMGAADAVPASSAAARSRRFTSTSPAPGWPSSKSVRGRRRGSAASYITAPSIQTVSGRE